ncbi:formate dehydrogenase subunit gamma [Azospirillum rugosum]|uniref:Formate dehydrogenase subunit gamma n=1 Tax=Azospirillum rugosum TaxID=416170 RepID=A0ABS4SNE9_9PROT|nr:formate dehydrogenase subunit gamma [Azospirillum rugosum]MBP2294080.1 formate dehydrogenase subunit gamma [Azospirillum rugosum]MDQ0527531.1 formate dehydrogenase subunit gamma [Azospirillum rugosum]
MKSGNRRGWFQSPLRVVLLGVAMLALTLVFANVPPASAAGETGYPTLADQAGATGAGNKAEMWRGIRSGEQGLVSIPNKSAGVLVQSEGEAWRSFRNGPLMTYGGWVLGGMLALLVLFFLVRGRIRIDGPKTGRTIQRFNAFERGVHWLTAGSFVVLAVTGLNVLYGRYTILPLLGPDVFAAMTAYGKLVHNYLGFAFILGVTLVFLMWVKHNIPNRDDIDWALKAGGLFSKGVHPPAKKFNAGQKVIFWATVLGGAALGFTGIQLLFPFSFAPMADMQLFQLVHAGIAVVLIAVIIAHIYIGSVGMEGAFDAMGNGDVELQWAREHHSLWVEEVTGERPRHHGGPGGRHHAPAE